jgi:hypothetical protein
MAKSQEEAIKALEKWASDNYENGADYVIECWGDEDYINLLEKEGSFTKALARLKKDVADYKAVGDDIRGA